MKVSGHSRGRARACGEMGTAQRRGQQIDIYQSDLDRVRTVIRGAQVCAFLG